MNKRRNVKHAVGLLGAALPGVRCTGLGLLALGLMAVSGCGPRFRNATNATVSSTGCPTEDLTLFDYDATSKTWGAKCLDKLYVCGSTGGGRCRERQPETVEPELLARVTLLEQLPRARRDRFIEVDVLEGSWEDFSRTVTVTQRLSDKQLEEVEDVDRVYTNLSAEFSDELIECDRLGVVKVLVNEKGKAKPQRGRACVYPLVARLSFKPEYYGRSLAVVAGYSDLKPLPRPVIDTKGATAAPETAPVADVESTPQTLSDEGPIRQWLDQHSDEILACNAGRTVAVRVEVDAQGAAKLELHGAAAGSPEASCFAAALTPPRFSPGPGTLIHLIKSKPAETQPAQ